MISPEEHLRLAHLAACEAEALSAVPAPSPQPRVPDHAAEVMAAHQGRPTVTEQDRTHGAGLPAVDKGRS